MGYSLRVLCGEGGSRRKLGAQPLLDKIAAQEQRRGLQAPYAEELIQFVMPNVMSLPTAKHDARWWRRWGRWQ